MKSKGIIILCVNTLSCAKLLSISDSLETQQYSIKFHIQPSRRVSRKDQGA